MLSYFIKYRESTESVNPKGSETNNSKKMILTKCAICGSKKSRFIKKQEESGILCSFGLTTPSSKVPLLGDILF